MFACTTDKDHAINIEVNVENVPMKCDDVHMVQSHLKDCILYAKDLFLIDEHNWYKE